MRRTIASHPFAEHFEAIFKYANIGILVTNQKGIIISTNPYAAKEFGYTKNELINKSIEKLIPSRFRKDHLLHHKKYLADTKGKKVMVGREITALHKNHKEFAVEITLSSYRYLNEQFVIVFIKNITSRKQHEIQIQQLTAELEEKAEQRAKNLEQTLEQLERNTAFQKALLENAGAMIVTTDTKGIIQSFNPAAEKHLGYKAEEVIGKHTPALFHVEEEVRLKTKEISKQIGRKLKPGFETFIARIAGDKMIETEWLHRRKDGSIFPVSLIVTPIKSAKNKISGYIGIVVDISDRKKAEEESTAIRNLLNDVFTNYPDGSIAVIDEKFRYIYTGGTIFTRLQINSGNLIGQRIFSLLSKEQWLQISRVLSQVFQGKNVSDVELPQFNNGLRLTMDAFPLKEKNGSINKIVVMTRNISELKRTQEELKIALQKEKELGELKSRFVSMASHEFRTPLSTILSSANLLERYTAAEDQSKRNKHIQYIISAVGMLTDTLNDFLSVGKIEEGRINIKSVETDIPQIIQLVIDEMTGLLKPGQTIKCIHTGKMKFIMDPSLLRHILMNLVSNATKFSGEGCAIEINSEIRGHQFTIRIKDEGIGISKEDQKHLMERFFRGTNAMNIQGTGLGLHIVARYVELLKGTITCISELEKGSEFIVKFHSKNLQYEKNLTN